MEHLPDVSEDHGEEPEHMITFSRHMQIGAPETRCVSLDYLTPNTRVTSAAEYSLSFYDKLSDLKDSVVCLDMGTMHSYRFTTEQDATPQPQSKQKKPVEKQPENEPAQSPFTPVQTEANTPKITDDPNYGYIVIAVDIAVLLGILYICCTKRITTVKLTWTMVSFIALIAISFFLL